MIEKKIINSHGRAARADVFSLDLYDQNNIYYYTDMVAQTFEIKYNTQGHQRFLSRFV